MEENKLPEAPTSVTIRGYYKGYSMLVTRRGEQNEMAEIVEDAIKAIDWMEDHDFKPSWADDTKPSGSGTESTTESDKPDFCNVHNAKMKAREGKFGTFYSHAKQFDDEWIYCKGKGWGK